MRDDDDDIEDESSRDFCIQLGSETVSRLHREAKVVITDYQEATQSCPLSDSSCSDLKSLLSELVARQPPHISSIWAQVLLTDFDLRCDF